MTWLVAFLAAMTVVLAPSAGAQDAGQAQDVYRLTIVRLNCDDEAESFSDEVELWVDGNFVDRRNNMDGGDWWDINRTFDFQSSIQVVIRENDNWVIGSKNVTTADANQGLKVHPMPGFHGTAYYYRLTYFVEGPF
ncbi:hypothetical protein ACIBEJ_07635 [Nonomuraea sp. NPDC050790]|uniref:hypothetical protein n=1 Tax=Nonomuraea sp. NPDC050790 TaxID=3364371 RepID=UPI0037B2943C